MPRANVSASDAITFHSIDDPTAPLDCYFQVQDVHTGKRFILHRTTFTYHAGTVDRHGNLVMAERTDLKIYRFENAEEVLDDHSEEELVPLNYVAKFKPVRVEGE
jgi:hypothetical protein